MSIIPLMKALGNAVGPERVPALIDALCAQMTSAEIVRFGQQFEETRIPDAEYAALGLATKT